MLKSFLVPTFKIYFCFDIVSEHAQETIISFSPDYFIAMTTKPIIFAAIFYVTVHIAHCAWKCLPGTYICYESSCFDNAMAMCNNKTNHDTDLLWIDESKTSVLTRFEKFPFLKVTPR